MMETVSFENQKFEIRELYLPKFGNVLVSTTVLNDLLFIDEDCVSEEAMNVDKQIFYFVEPEEINLSDKDLRSIISQQVL